MNCFAANKAPLIARYRSGKVLIMLLGQGYVGPNRLWAAFVTIIVQFMQCLVLCCVVALLACPCFFYFFACQGVHAKIDTAYRIQNYTFLFPILEKVGINNTYGTVQ